MLCNVGFFYWDILYSRCYHLVCNVLVCIVSSLTYLSVPGVPSELSFLSVPGVLTFLSVLGVPSELTFLHVSGGPT